MPSRAWTKFAWAVEADILHAALARVTGFGECIAEFGIKMYGVPMENAKREVLATSLSPG